MSILNDYVRTDAEIARWVETMDQVGVEKVVILSGSTGAKLDSTIERYGKYPKRFAVWCGIDFTGLRQPGFGQAALLNSNAATKRGRSALVS